MPILAIIITVFIAGTGIGGIASYKLQQAKVVNMELKILQANDQAASVLAVAKAKVQESQLEAIKSNKELDEKNEKHIQDIKRYYDALHIELNKRVYDNKSSSANALPKGSDTGKPEASTTTTRFSKEYVEFLEEQLKQASEASNYASEAGEFILNECGIK